MKTEIFNEQIIKGAENDDPEMQNWIATTFGRHFNGVEAEVESLPYFCPFCGCPDLEDNQIAKRRLCTSYVDDEKNWLLSCCNCFAKIDSEYQGMWDDYWSMVL